MTAVASLPAARSPGFFEALAPGGRRALFVLGLIAVCLLFAFPVFWLVLTSLRPGYPVYYVHRGTDFTLDNFHDVLSQEIVLKALWNSFAISTLATVLSLGVTVTPRERMVASVEMAKLFHSALSTISWVITSCKLSSVKSVPRCT